MAKQTLEGWIKEAFADDTKEGDPTGISLVLMQGVVEKEIYTLKIGSKPFTPRDLASIMKHKAEGYTQDIPGVHTFCLKVFYSSSEEAQARHPFRIHVHDQAMEGMGSEPPTKLGFVQMAMRHSENMHSMMLTSLKQITESSQQIIKSQQEQINGLVIENADAFKLIKEEILRKAASAHDYRMKELNYARSTEERKKLLAAAPAVINTIAGREIFPNSVADESIIDLLIEEITPEQVEQLMNILPPNLIALIMPRIQSALEAKRLANAQAGALIKDPEADAAGG